MSVVATGIDQEASPARVEPRPLSLGAGRAPKRPVMPLSADAELAADAAPAAAEVQPVQASQPSFEAPAPAAAASESPVAQPYEAPREAAFGGHGQQPQAAPEADAEPFELTFALDADEPAPAPASAPEAAPHANGLGNLANDGLLNNADRLAQGEGPANSQTAAPAPAPVAAPAAAKPAQAGGSTLFERMANLSRNARNGADDDDDAGGSALNIPRFLGRQNNQ